jgi:hypothetical protein
MHNRFDKKICQFLSTEKWLGVQLSGRAVFSMHETCGSISSTKNKNKTNNNNNNNFSTEKKAIELNSQCAFGDSISTSTEKITDCDQTNRNARKSVVRGGGGGRSGDSKGRAPT